MADGLYKHLDYFYAKLILLRYAYAALFDPRISVDVMWLIVVLIVAALAGALLGVFLGKKWMNRILICALISWIAAFCIAAWFKSEPATTVLGWGFLPFLPTLIIAAAFGNLADEYVVRLRAKQTSTSNTR